MSWKYYNFVISFDKFMTELKCYHVLFDLYLFSTEHTERLNKIITFR